jgi:BetI-type transcriptional repressor, C-terminal
VSGIVIADLRAAQERRVLRPDFDLDAAAATLLAAMDGLQLRYLLTPDGLRIDEAFAALGGQMLAALAYDSPEAAAKIAAWRREYDPTAR